MIDVKEDYGMAKGGFPGMGGKGGNLNNLVRQAQKMQQEMLKVQEELEDKMVEASSGGGAVTVTANGKKEIKEIKIKPEAVDPQDIEMLQDLVVAAVNEALRKAEEMANKEIARVTGGLGGGLLAF